MSRKRRPTTTVPGAEADVPDFVHKYPTKGSEDWRPEDVAWIGEDGNLDSETLLNDHGFDPRLPLEYILLAIIDAHPRPEEDRQTRLEKALAALVGTGQLKSGV